MYSTAIPTTRLSDWLPTVWIRSGRCTWRPYVRLQKLILESRDLRLLRFAAVGHDGTHNEMEGTCLRRQVGYVPEC